MLRLKSSKVPTPLGQFLHRILIRHNKNVQTMAEDIGMDDRTFARILTQTQPGIHLDKLLALADGLDVDILVLLALARPEFIDKLVRPKKGKVPPTEVLEIIDSMEDVLPPDVLEKINKIIAERSLKTSASVSA